MALTWARLLHEEMEMLSLDRTLSSLWKQ